MCVGVNSETSFWLSDDIYVRDENIVMCDPKKAFFIDKELHTNGDIFIYGRVVVIDEDVKLKATKIYILAIEHLIILKPLNPRNSFIFMPEKYRVERFSPIVESTLRSNGWIVELLLLHYGKILNDNVDAYYERIEREGSTSGFSPNDSCMVAPYVMKPYEKENSVMEKEIQELPKKDSCAIEPYVKEPFEEKNYVMETEIQKVSHFSKRVRVPEGLINNKRCTIS